MYRMDRINRIIDEIYQKHNVIREIDFDRDIDTEKSDRFVIDEKERYLEFLFKSAASISLCDYTVILGEIKEEENRTIRLISSLEKLTEDSLMRAYLLVENKVPFKETDMVFFNIERSKEFAFNIGLNNYSRYNHMHMIKNHETGFFEKSEERISFMSTFTGNEAFLNYVTGNGAELLQTLEMRDTASIQYILDFKNNLVILNERKYKMPLNSFIEKDTSYINLALLPVKEQEKEPWVHIKEISYGKEQGYIYFNLNLRDYKTDKIGIYCISSANPGVQVYSKTREEWCDLNQNRFKADHEDIQIRIRMKFGDKIYKIFVVQY